MLDTILKKIAQKIMRDTKRDTLALLPRLVAVSNAVIFAIREERLHHSIGTLLADLSSVRFKEDFACLRAGHNLIDGKIDDALPLFVDFTAGGPQHRFAVRAHRFGADWSGKPTRRLRQDWIACPCLSWAKLLAKASVRNHPARVLPLYSRRSACYTRSVPTPYRRCASTATVSSSSCSRSRAAWALWSRSHCPVCSNGFRWTGQRASGVGIGRVFRCPVDPAVVHHRRSWWLAFVPPRLAAKSLLIATSRSPLPASPGSCCNPRNRVVA